MMCKIWTQKRVVHKNNLQKIVWKGFLQYLQTMIRNANLQYLQKKVIWIPVGISSPICVKLLSYKMRYLANSVFDLLTATSHPPLFQDSLSERMLTTTNPLEEDLSALPREVSTSPLEAWGTNQIIGKICPDPRVNRRDKNALYSVNKFQLMVCSLKMWDCITSFYHPSSFLCRRTPCHSLHHRLEL